MTTIAWDGKTLAADKRGVMGGHTYTLTKIARIDGCLVGVSGRGDRIREFQEWVADGRKREAYPKRDEQNTFTGHRGGARSRH